MAESGANGPPGPPVRPRVDPMGKRPGPEFAWIPKPPAWAKPRKPGFAILSSVPRREILYRIAIARAGSSPAGITPAGPDSAAREPLWAQVRVQTKYYFK